MGALTRNVTNEHVREIFSNFGKVKSAEVSMDRTVRSTCDRGFFIPPLILDWTPISSAWWACLGGWLIVKAENFRIQGALFWGSEFELSF